MKFGVTQRGPAGEFVFAVAGSEDKAASHHARCSWIYGHINVRFRVVIDLDATNERRSRRQSVNDVGVRQGIARCGGCGGDEADSDAA